MNRKVWKIASQWGEVDWSVLELFFNYGCVFFGGAETPDTPKDFGVGNYREVKENDLILVCDKDTPVAIARALGAFTSYQAEENKVQFTPTEEQCYGRPDVRICKVELAILPKDKRKQSLFRPKRRSRFCQLRKGADAVIEFWELHKMRKNQGEFEIQCRTAHLHSSTHKVNVFDPSVRYHIPIYQRPYSWGENELRQLLEDLSHSLEYDEPVFMGTMQVSEPLPLNPNGTRNSFDVIDGQQRLTTFSLLIQLLKAMLGMPYEEKEQLVLGTHVNRGAAQRELNGFWCILEKLWLRIRTEKLAMLIDEDEANPYLCNLRRLQVFLFEYFSQEDTLSEQTLRNLLTFINEKVQFVIIETHAGISKTIKIFNTINTAGLELGTEDLFKLRLYEYLKDKRICKDARDDFDGISRIYEQVENRKQEMRASGKHMFSMSDVLATYQRILIAQHKLGYDAYKMGTQRFFDSLFDTALHIRPQPGFKEKFDPNLNPDGRRLSLSDLKRLYECYDYVYRRLDEDAELRIFHNFSARTRYGHQACDSIVIAKYFHNNIEDGLLVEFAEGLFKLLVPPSLVWSKKTKPIRRRLLQLLHDLSDSEKSVLDILRQNTDGMMKAFPDMRVGVEACCNSPVTHNLLVKQLLCRLCEYHAGQRSSHALFAESIDIEHIQPYNDEDESKRHAIWSDWGDEINSLGNLVLLEQSVNKSIGNKRNRKADAYAKSIYIGVRHLAARVGNWTKHDAEERRKELVAQLMGYLFSCKQSSH